MRHTRHINLSRAQGITIVEVVVVIAILAIMIPVFATVLIGSYRDSFYANDRIQSTNKALMGLQFMEDSVRAASDYLVAVPSPFTDVYGPHNLGTAGGEAWSYKGDSATSRVLLLSSNATSEAALGIGRQPVYRSDGPYNCTTQKQYQQKLTYVTAFFVRNGKLYRRVMNDRVSPLCAGESQAEMQSCPPEIASGSLDASCQARDEVMATNITNFNVTYWQDTYLNQIDAYNSTDPTILDAADYITVDITVSTRNGQVTQSLTERMTKINR